MAGGVACYHADVYTLLDLETRLHLTEEWLALGDERVALRDSDCEAQASERTAVRAIREEPGPSATFLHILAVEVLSCARPYRAR